MSAEERRECVLEAAMIEFGVTGYVGTPTEAIARRVGVSQPYLFRLFPSKKAIFLATIDRCFDRIIALFVESGSGKRGEDALAAMGAAYNSLLDDRAILQLQLQMWSAACQDDDVRDVARGRMADIWSAVQSISGEDDLRVMQFLASGMLLNVQAALDLPRVKGQLGHALIGLVTPDPAPDHDA